MTTIDYVNANDLLPEAEFNYDYRVWELQPCEPEDYPERPSGDHWTVEVVVRGGELWRYSRADLREDQAMKLERRIQEKGAVNLEAHWRFVRLVYGSEAFFNGGAGESELRAFERKAYQFEA